MLAIAIHPLASAEIEAVSLYYEHQANTLGEQFLEELGISILRIRHFPYMYQSLFSPYHRAPIHRFPYTILYRKADTTIHIDAVFPTKSAPQKMLESLAKRLN